MNRTATNVMARELLAANESELARLTPQLVAAVAEELDMRPLPAGDEWPADLIAVIREFLTCIAMDDLERIGESGSIFEQVGRESARGGVEFDQLAAAIRTSSRRIQAQVHRAVLAASRTEDAEEVLDLLGRVVTAGEAVVLSAQRGYEIAAFAGADEDNLARRLASALIYGHGRVVELAAAVGWPAGTHVCAVLVAPDAAAEIRQRSSIRVAYYSRGHDVVLIHPVGEGQLATTLRPLLADHDGTVGPAVPLTDLPSSLHLAQRASALADSARGALFADDFLLELGCGADPGVISALRRKYFADLDLLPVDQRGVLMATLREWLLQWGHRPGIAETLGVHPQTVSGRINRLKDLLADDLEAPHTRSELLVLVTAMSLPEEAQAARPHRHGVA